MTDQRLSQTISLWHLDLDASFAWNEACLSAEEQDRAARLPEVRNRHLYRRAHIGLRGVLARYANCCPREIEFGVGWNGKPYIIGSPWQFSLSHSGRRALVALTRVADIGADIERLRPRKLDRKTAERFFTETEAHHLSRHKTAEYNTAFAQLWTMKEAFIKGTGEGLARSLKSFDIDPNGPQISGASDSDDWQIARVLMPDGYVGALAVKTEHPLLFHVHNQQELKGCFENGQHIPLSKKLRSNARLGCAGVSVMQ